MNFHEVPKETCFGLEMSLEASIALDLLNEAAPSLVAECGKDQASATAVVERFYELAEVFISHGLSTGYIRKHPNTKEQNQ